jgi:hypothetical protein
VQDYTVHCDCCWIDATYACGIFRKAVTGMGWQVIKVTRWAAINDLKTYT